MQGTTAPDGPQCLQSGGWLMCCAGGRGNVGGKGLRSHHGEQITPLFVPEMIIVVPIIISLSNISDKVEEKKTCQI